MDARISRFSCTLALLAVAIAWPLGSTPAGQTAPPTDEQVMDRAGHYVVGYGEQLPLLIATESYSQWKEDEEGSIRPWHQTLLAEFVLMRLETGDDWVAYRDTYEKDGKRLGEATDRLQRLFVRGGEKVGSAAARSLSNESAQLNLARMGKAFNTPTMALFFLRPANQARFEFKRSSEDKVSGVRVWRIRYKETTRPTLYRSPGGRDMPVEGSAWINPDDGRVYRTHMEIVLRAERTVNRNDSLASVTVTYRPDPEDAFLVPREMLETYEFLEPRTISGRDIRTKVNCTATYTDVKRIGR